ncbi:MAG TPA: hypothetical protein VE077_14920 [Candidatus Methylomirabilis sp.]|nr:hypothetical protein [Candidatus Methylomirabilis sp.]
MGQNSRIGAGDPEGSLTQAGKEAGHCEAPEALPVSADELRLRAQRLSLREQLERNHFLLERLNAASARLIQSLEAGDAFEAVGEIIANLIGSEELAIFQFCPTTGGFSLNWSSGVDSEILQRMSSGAGMLGRAAHQAASQFRERQPKDLLLPYEKNLTACVALKSGQEPVGVMAIFGLLPQKQALEWADFELLKFLEVYGAAAIEVQRLEKKLVAL